MIWIKSRRFTYPKPRPSEITPESLYRDRRRFLAGSTALAVGAVTAPLLRASEDDWRSRLGDPLESEWRSPELKDELTSLQDIRTYNNFWEFGSSKTDPYQRARRMEIDPWSVRVEGECERPGTYALEDFLAPHDFEERIYRLRCVEAWSMVIPWIGFPLGDALKRFEPTSRAKYVAFETHVDEEAMPGVQRGLLDFPYRDALRIDEAVHPLTILAVGLYNDPLPPQNGAPLRLVVPWKYGYKSVKSIVGIRFSEERPPCLWEEEQPEEYGWYANVNPDIDHPRWNQARERRIGERGRRRTELYNGYAEEVAHLYPGDPGDYW